MQQRTQALDITDGRIQNTGSYILSLADNKNYTLIIHGSAADPKLKVLETRLMSSVSNQVEVILVHGSADLLAGTGAGSDGSLGCGNNPGESDDAG